MPDYNPLSSRVTDIFLGNFSILEKNDFCQYERIEYIESVFEIFPSGSLIVRDTSDIMTKILQGEIEYITISYMSGDDEVFFITGVSQVNNAGSSTEENFITINFSNELFKINQKTTVSEILSLNYPVVYDIIDAFYDISDGLFSSLENSSHEDLVTNVENFENYVVVRPLNPTETKVDIPSDNPLQYLNYLSSLACSSATGQPRFLFWTGFNNQIYFKYFYESASEDPSAGSAKSFATYEADVPVARVRGKSREKIYMLTTAPADQYINRNYYYIRKTPKILNNDIIDGPEDEELLFNHYYLDDGSRYDYELITENGVVETIPTNFGYNILPYNGSYGYYTQGDVDDLVASTSLLSGDYGNQNIHEFKEILGVANPYPFVDNSQMWKNMFDLTTIHPDQGNSSLTSVSGNNTNLQKVFEVRENARIDTRKSNISKNIEKQNFILHVLCCIKNRIELAEETFFACITGWEPDPLYGPESENPILGFNGEPLIYRYYWRRLAAYLPEDGSAWYDFSYYSNPENTNRWDYISEQSTSFQTMAINLNERTNLGPEQFSLGYYGSGWYATALLDEVFQNVKYRPIGNDGGDLDEYYDPEGYPCLHIVKMHKIPYTKIIDEAANFSSAFSSDLDMSNVIANAVGKYVYHFELTNITDGPCNIVESPPPPPPPPPPEELVDGRAQRTIQ